jgi:hypothetical protein
MPEGDGIAGPPPLRMSRWCVFWAGLCGAFAGAQTLLSAGADDRLAASTQWPLKDAGWTEAPTGRPRSSGPLCLVMPEL